MADTTKPDVNPKEVQITPEMVQAGPRAYYRHDSRFYDDEDVVKNVFIAMVSLQASPPKT
ncbi:MAG: hypothetical protein WDN48_07620 [Pseudolabrys sp.]